MTREENRCEYVTRRAGETFGGTPAILGGYGDVTQTCGKFGKPVQHTYYSLKPGTRTIRIPHQGTTVRCPEHADT